MRKRIHEVPCYDIALKLDCCKKRIHEAPCYDIALKLDCYESDDS